VRDIIQERLESLPPDALRVALAVAAGVEPVEHALLGRVVPFGEVRLVDAIRTAMRARVLDITADGYVFQLGLYREELETWHLPSERVILHRAYAQALSGRRDDPQHARLAHHWRHAGEPRRALPAAIRAAQEAERRYGYPEALAYWTLALEIVDRNPELATVDRVALAQSAAEAARRGGAHERSLELLDDIATRLTEPPPMWWHTARARALAASSRLAEAEKAYRQALAAPDGAALDRAMAAARSAELLVQVGQYEQAGARAREALALIEGLSGTTSVEVLARTTLGFSQAFLDDAEAGRAAVEAAVFTAERAGSPADLALAVLPPGQAAHRAAQPARRRGRGGPLRGPARGRAGPGPHPRRLVAGVGRQRACSGSAAGARPRASWPRRWSTRPRVPRWSTCCSPGASSTLDWAT
jgi:tetratricopeptide (TPR) repeat protein